jgi:hypothetical protein
MPSGSQSGQQSGDQTGDAGVPDPLAGETSDPNAEESPDLAWEKVESGGASESEWESSNELPSGGGAAGQEGEQGELAGAEGGMPGSGEEDAEGGQAGGGGSTEDELEGALQDFDGEILAERDVLKSTETPSTSAPLPSEPSGQPGGRDGDGDQQPGGPIAGRPVPNIPAPPSRSGEVPDDIPDAKDDDIIARQLREAAMQEEDPELKEKLWDEYRRYKKG